MRGSDQTGPGVTAYRQPTLPTLTIALDFPYVLVRLRCDTCKRAGAYRLAVKYGAEILLDDLLVRLSAGCPWRDEPRGTCGVRFEDMPPQRPPDLPGAFMRLRVVKGSKT
jgi:hypothetical protein